MNGDLYDPTEPESELDEPAPRCRVFALSLAVAASFVVTLGLCLGAMALDVTGGVAPHMNTRIALMFDPPMQAETQTDFDVAAGDDWLAEAALPPTAPTASVAPTGPVVIYSPNDSTMEAGPVSFEGAAIHAPSDEFRNDEPDWAPADDPTSSSDELQDDTY